MRKLSTAVILLTLISVMSGCVIAPREGYYDRDHHRYYHQNTWHDCRRNDQHCH